MVLTLPNPAVVEDQLESRALRVIYAGVQSGNGRAVVRPPRTQPNIIVPNVVFWQVTEDTTS
jgi:hypothetical protein